MKDSVYSKVVLLCLSFSVLAQPMLKAQSAISERASQFMTTLNHFKECAMRKGACTKAEKATIRTSLSAAAFLLIVGLIGLNLKSPENKLREEISELAKDTQKLWKPHGFSYKLVGTYMAEINQIRDRKKRIKKLKKLKRRIQDQLKVK